MTVSDETQLYVAAIQHLLDRYCAHFPDDEERLSVLRDQVRSGEPHLANRKTLPGHLTGAALVLDVDAQKVLLIEHKFLQRWLQPGGHLDPGEHPQVGAVRELTEEVGSVSAVLHPWHGVSAIPLDIDSHKIPANSAKGEPEHLHHDWLYVFTASSEAPLTLQETEVISFQWVPVAQLLGGQFGSRLQRVGQRLSQLQLCDAQRTDA